MADYPPDLIDTLARRLFGLDFESSDHDIAVYTETAARTYHPLAAAILDVLASWCDGDLFDPATGQRVTADTGHWPNHHCTVHDDCADDLDTQVGWCIEGSKPGDCNLVPTYTLTRKDQT